MPGAAKWKPGQSGNPAGRPKNKTLAEIATAEDKRLALNVIREALKNKNQKVAMWFLEQVYGKAKQVIEGSGEDGAFSFDITIGMNGNGKS